MENVQGCERRGAHWEATRARNAQSDVGDHRTGHQEPHLQFRSLAIRFQEVICCAFCACYQGSRLAVAETPAAYMAELLDSLEALRALLSVNGPEPVSPYTSTPRTILDRDASTSCKTPTLFPTPCRIRCCCERPLELPPIVRTKFMVTKGYQFIILPALAFPFFQEKNRLDRAHIAKG